MVTQNASQPTCGRCIDSPLTTAASIITILTFVYAVIAGFIVYLYQGTQFLRNTDKEIVEFAQSLESSYKDIKAIAGGMQGTIERRPPLQTRELMEEVGSIFREADVKLHALAMTITEYMPGSYDSSWWKQWRERASFIVEKDKLKEMQKNFNKTMDDLRRIQEKIMNAERGGKDTEMRNEMLKEMDLSKLERHQQLEMLQLLVEHLHKQEVQHEVLGKLSSVRRPTF